MKSSHSAGVAVVALACLLHGGAGVAPDVASQNLRRAQQYDDSFVAQPDASGVFAPRMVQKEVEQMELRAKRLETTDAETAVEVEGALEDLEGALATRAVADAALEEEIGVVRADLCARHGFESRERQDCEAFMRGACFPKRARSRKQPQSSAFSGDTDALAQAQPPLVVSAMVCRTFFREVAASESHRAAMAMAGAPSPVGPMAPSPAAAQPASPSPAAPWHSMDPEQGLQEDGYSGRLVDHDDQETQTSDWQSEFGPNAGHRSIEDVCRSYPESEWCQLHMHYHGHGKKWWQRSGAPSSSIVALSALVAIVILAMV
eukprot:CAMPEP_0176009066 /NCGR_PEP_ID=MMETSP0120_2-20121206/4062_1 /TAXON_ID=160619 /ORGANISM="Kryptoperidinium foliaceum, Strain CCMP 1326" /LENGTH=317 /DNA_ID=CAMNT_0017341857 /DNA_START=72 /DNA_END=1025 /DNA_ORIENTATION=-